MSVSASAGSGLRVPLCLVLVGVIAALHIWKLPPALPLLQAELGIDLVESGFLVSVVQLAGMTLGLLAGLAAQRMGLRRSILGGLGLLVGVSALGALVDTAGMMMMLRAVEGCGFLMTVMPIPSLMRRLVPANVLSRVMGLWSCYIPVGSILVLVLGSWMLSHTTWRHLWLLLAVLTLGALLLVWMLVPEDRAVADTAVAPGDVAAASSMALVRQTLGALPVWLVALTFGMYSAQWMAIVGFLPTIYAAAGLMGTTAGLLTGLVAGANILGNLMAGQLLHRNVPARTLLIFGFSTMMLCAWLAFGAGLPVAGQFASVAVLSAVGGLIPATMFVSALTVAPSPQTTTTTVGWMQQGSSLGQFCGPPVVAWGVSAMGGWQYAWIATAMFSAAGIVLAVALERSMAAGNPTASEPSRA